MRLIDASPLLGAAALALKQGHVIVLFCLHRGLCVSGFFARLIFREARLDDMARSD